jgi:Na+/H+ antiporter NhaD/arsenite permease-like protein
MTHARWKSRFWQGTGPHGWMAFGAVLAVLVVWPAHAMALSTAAPASNDSAIDLKAAVALGATGDPEAPPLWGLGIVPFLAILSAIAVLPLLRATRHWWESNSNRLLVALGCAAMTLVYYLLVVGGGPGTIVGVLQHAVLDEYIPFIVLLFSLYVICGGINLRGDVPAHPVTNTMFLAVGAAIASVVGTTGASMLLIRPLLQTNAERTRVTHTVVFFIFLVSNVGGCLLPIGDPPLFLGYLRGVPFFWTLGLWKEWAAACIALLVIYFIWDTLAYRREAVSTLQRDELMRAPLRLRGWSNLLWLLGVVACVAFVDPTKPLPGTGWTPFPFLREGLMLGFVAASLTLTPRGVRQANRFNYHAIIEVAALFIGIFIPMQVPVAVLNALGDQLGLERPWQFFWATGVLSSFLDNAPTYVVFLETANSMTHEAGPGVLMLTSGEFVRADLLIGISLGAVFMGAMTYIGNGPNFMVKSIAEQGGVRMPSFFGFLLRYSIPVLVPLFIAITVLFVH